MAIAFSCPCGVELTVPVALGGHRGACPACQRSLEAPEPTPAGSSLPTGRSFHVVRIGCRCGRRVAAPVVRLKSGEARCPSCDRVLVA